MQTAEEQIRKIVTLMYDTGVPLDELEREVIPFLSAEVSFVDPAVRGHGFDKIRVGLRGFHTAFKFHFDITQMSVQISEGRGRALIDGVMHLRPVPGYTYPLRTVLVYEFTLREDGAVRVTSIEEMWPIGDLLANAPLGLGKLYGTAFRTVSGMGFLGFFWLTTVLRRGRVRQSR
ncbi:MAG TPA: hypothetical protein VH083_12045 [Myxococcales bacterium]|jgi:hypothetical protein|nr:hypothetical protein [Myxococcales bacterium]